MSEAVQLLGWGDFLELESAGQRHELVGGRVFTISGGTERHDLMAGLLALELANASRVGPCRTFTQNRLVRTQRGNGYYPDVLLVCAPATHRLYETDADVIIEVLSDSTETVDRRERPAPTANYRACKPTCLSTLACIASRWHGATSTADGCGRSYRPADCSIWSATPPSTSTTCTTNWNARRPPPEAARKFLVSSSGASRSVRLITQTLDQRTERCIPCLVTS